MRLLSKLIGNFNVLRLLLLYAKSRNKKEVATQTTLTDTKGKIVVPDLI
jgi:hypothetical protein